MSNRVGPLGVRGRRRHVDQQQAGVTLDVQRGVVDDVIGDNDAGVFARPARHLGVLPADEVGQLDDDGDDGVPLGAHLLREQLDEIEAWSDGAR